MNKRIKNIMTFVLTFIFIAIIGYGVMEVKADFIGEASEWYKKGGNTESIDLTEIANLVNIAGTAVIAIVTVVLGTKYMLGSATGKSEVKEQLISLLVACVLFFGWSNLSGILISGANFNSTTGGYSGVGGNTQLFIFQKMGENADISTVFAEVFAIVMFIARIVAVVVTMVIGVKYIFGGADVKSSIKQKGPMYIIGILMIFCTVGILSFISDSIIKALTV